MVKKIIIAVVCVLLVVALAFGAWWFFLRPTPLKGSLDNYHKVSVYLRDNTYYDVWVPNEAKLITTDEHISYEFDLLEIGVQPYEPTADYKVKVNDVWVYALSKDKWLKPTIKGFEEEQPYVVKPVYEKTVDENGFPIVWADGSYPSGGTEVVSDATHVLEGGDYLIKADTNLGLYADNVQNILGRLCHLTKGYVPHYYDDGKIMYAKSGNYAVGLKYVNYNTTVCYIAKGAGIGELVTLLLMEG